MYTSNFQVRLRTLREDSGYSSQAAFAKVFGVAQSTVAGWESGAREPNFETLKKLADFFFVTTDYILGFNSVFGLISDGMSPIRVYLTLSQKKDISAVFQTALQKQNVTPDFVITRSRADSDFWTRINSQNIRTVLLHDLVSFSSYLGVSKDVYAILGNPGELDQSDRPAISMDIANQVYHKTHDDDQLIESYHQAPTEIRKIVDTALAPYSPQNASTTNEAM